MPFNDTTNPATGLATTPAYHGDGPVFDSESVHQALGENTAFSLAGHMLNKPAQGISFGLAAGHGFEHEPVNQDEQAAQHVAQDNAQRNSAQNGQQNGQGTPSFDYSESFGNVRQAMRPGAGL